MMVTAARVLDIARNQLGTTERPPGSNCQKFSHELGRPCQFWCADFIAWVAREAGLPLPSNSAFTPAMKQGFINAERYFAEPEVGDVGMIDFPGGRRINEVEHVAWVVKFDDDWVWTVEGNTSASDAGVQDNGGGVFERVRSRSLFLGFGRPDYDDIPKRKGGKRVARLKRIDGTSPVWLIRDGGSDKRLVNAGADLAECVRVHGEVKVVKADSDEAGQLRKIPISGPRGTTKRADWGPHITDKK